MRKAKDISGQRFGKLTAEKRIKEEGSNRFLWLCQCDCGKTTKASLTDLIRGKVKSCGCARLIPDNDIDLIGKQFGKLTVIREAPKGRGGGRKWICQCQCGKQITTYTSHLLGKQRSCGCNNADLVGQKFEHLTVVKFMGTSHQGKQWLCKCDCGNTVVTTTGKLNAGRTKTCGKCRIAHFRQVSNSSNRNPITINPITIMEDYILVFDKNGRSFKCDIDDMWALEKHLWYVDATTGRPRTVVNGKTVRFYRMILNAPPNKVVDHINGDASDNRKSNLRICSPSDNAKNKHMQKNGLPVGVHFVERCSVHPYVATISIKGKQLQKHFATKDKAIAQRKTWEKEYYGEYAPTITSEKSIEKQWQKKQTNEA